VHHYNADVRCVLLQMCLHVGNWKKLYRKAFSWKVMMYLYLAVTFVLLLVIVVFLVVTSNQNELAIAVRRLAFVSVT